MLGGRATLITLGNKGFGAWDISTTLGAPHTQIKNHVSQSGQNFSEFGFLCEKKAQKLFVQKSSQIFMGIFLKFRKYLLFPKTYYFLESDQ